MGGGGPLHFTTGPPAPPQSPDLAVREEQVALALDALQDQDQLLRRALLQQQVLGPRHPEAVVVALRHRRHEVVQAVAHDGLALHRGGPEQLPVDQLHDVELRGVRLDAGDAEEVRRVLAVQVLALQARLGDRDDVVLAGLQQLRALLQQQRGQVDHLQRRGPGGLSARSPHSSGWTETAPGARRARGGLDPVFPGMRNDDLGPTLTHVPA